MTSYYFKVESVIEGTNGIRTTGAFRYVTIKDHPDQQYFVHHAVLQKLGLYLMDTFRFNPQNKRKALPLVLCAQNPETEEYIVVGIWNTPSRAEGPKRNTIPPAFRYLEDYWWLCHGPPVKRGSAAPPSASLLSGLVASFLPFVC